MPIIKSAQKRMKQTAKKTAHNRVIKRVCKSAIKNTMKEIEAKNSEGAKKLLVTAYKKIDKAAKKNLMHKNTAARRKSRLAKLANAIEAK